MTENTPLAETVTGFGLFVTGIVAVFLDVELAAVACFVTVGLIACARSYTRAIAQHNRKQ